MRATRLLLVFFFMLLGTQFTFSIESYAMCCGCNTCKWMMNCSCPGQNGCAWYPCSGRSEFDTLYISALSENGTLHFSTVRESLPSTVNTLDNADLLIRPAGSGQCDRNNVRFRFFQHANVLSLHPIFMNYKSGPYLLMANKMPTKGDE